MKQLSTDAAGLIESARRTRPSALAKERGRARLLAATSAGALSAASMTAKATLVASSASTTAASVAGSVAGALLLGVALGSAGMAVSARIASPARLAPSAVVAHMPLRPSPAQQPPSVAQAPMAPTAEPLPVAPPAAPPAPPPTVVRASQSARPSPAALVEAAAPSISRETELIALAQGALAQGRAGDALRVLESYRAEFPSGALREEASGARALALCRSGHAHAERAKIDFLNEFPSSPLAARVLSACKTSTP